MTRNVFVLASWVLVALVVAGAALFGVQGAVVAAIPACLLVVGAFAAYMMASARAGGPRVPRAAAAAPVEPMQGAVVEDEPRSKNIGRIVIIALMVHSVAAFGLNMTNLNVAVAPDTVANRYCGVFLSRSWADPSYDAIWGDMESRKPELCVSYKKTAFHQKLNGLVEYFVGNEKFTHVSMGLLNGFVGVLAAYVMAQVARRLYGNYAEERTLLYIAFFPSLIVWRSINLREGWSFFLLSAAIYTGIRLRERFTMRNLATFALCVGCMPFIRAYIMVLFAIGIILSYVVVRVRQIPAAIVTSVIFFGGIQTLASHYGFTPEDLNVEAGLAQLHVLHQGLAGGGSSFGTDVDLTTPVGALSYLPKGVALFLFSPFPWTISSWRQIAAIPESIFWYVMLYRAVRQVIRSARDDLMRIALPVSVTVVMTVAYGLVEGNGGTAYRHRAHVVLIALMFAGGDAAYRRRQRLLAAREPASKSPLLSGATAEA